MKAMILKEITNLETQKHPLSLVDLPEPVPSSGEIRIKISTCGVCHTELDEIEGRARPPRLPVVLGHQVVGRVEGRGICYRDVLGAVEMERSAYPPAHRHVRALAAASCVA